jgi:hypothetical protein
MGDQLRVIMPSTNSFIYTLEFSLVQEHHPIFTN